MIGHYKEHWVKFNNRNVGFIFVNDDDKKIYVTDRKKVFEVQKIKGFSISKGIFKILRRAGVQTIRIKLLKENGGTEVYVSSLKNWLERGKINYYGVSDQQLFLPLESFEGVPEK